PRGNAGLEKFLDKRGPGLHHICVQVEGIEEALATLKAAGVPLIDEVPRPGARGHKVAFLHPKALGGVLIELEEPSSRKFAVRNRETEAERTGRRQPAGRVTSKCQLPEQPFLDARGP